jgi:hypothetical protein
MRRKIGGKKKNRREKRKGRVFWTFHPLHRQRKLFFQTIFETDSTSSANPLH